MAQQDITLPDDGAGVLDAAKASRALHKRADPINRTEVSFLCVDPVLAALGWNTREPRQVRRPDGHVAQLLEKSTPIVSIHAIEAGKDLPKSAPKDSTAPWIIATNGLVWNVYSAEDPKTLVQSISLETPATARDSMGALAVLAREGFSSDRLTRAWSPEAVDRSIADAIASALSSPSDLVSLVRSKLGKSAGGLSDEDIASSIGRIKFAVNDAEVSAAADEAETPAPAAKAKPAAKSRGKAGTKAGSKTAAKRGTKAQSSKTGAKTSTKGKKPAAATTKANDAQAAEGSGTDSAKPEDATAQATSSPAAETQEPDWPNDATHKMKRKKTVAFITLDKESGSATLLPGSLLTPNIGKTLAAQQVSAREQSIEDGSLKPSGDMLEVTTPMTFENLRLAASFSAGTLVKDVTAWTDREGKELSEEDLPAREPEPAAA